MTKATDYIVFVEFCVRHLCQVNFVGEAREVLHKASLMLELDKEDVGKVFCKSLIEIDLCTDIEKVKKTIANSNIEIDV